MKPTSTVRVPLLIATGFVSTAAAAEPQSAEASRPGVRIEVGRRSVQVVGLSPRHIELLTAYEEAGKGWSDLFPVFTGSVARPAGRTMLGTYARTNAGLRFEPRFELTARQKYAAIFRLDLISPCEGGEAVTRDFRFGDDRPSGEATSVSQVFPTGDVLPENLLKFYLRFSAPMSRGAYRHVRLLDSTGEPVELPFLEIDEELWNPEGTRLTLLFDPGRIKRGVKPREDIGGALREGETYSLVLDAAWPDANGQPLAREFRKEFRVGPPDEVQPDHKRWNLEPPAAGSRDPLTVRFDEPLDRAMLERVLLVRTAAGAAVHGRVEVEPGESVWLFRPGAPWALGKHVLIVETTLEDRAGNSIGRAFEVAADGAGKTLLAKEVSIAFDTAPAH